jgi:hypothetical protein
MQGTVSSSTSRKRRNNLRERGLNDKRVLIEFNRFAWAIATFIRSSFGLAADPPFSLDGMPTLAFPTRAVLA